MPQPQNESELFRLVPELRLIANVSVKGLVTGTFLDLVDERYWDAPSSFSGKFHLVPDGTGKVDTQLDSCRRAARIAHHLATLYGFNPIGTDTVVAASLLHDICAGSPDWDKTNPDHAFFAAELIRGSNEYQSSPWEMGSDWQNVVKDIAYCIEHHMAWWGGENWNSVISRNNLFVARAAQLVAIGDYLSSMEDIWMQLPEDKIRVMGLMAFVDVQTEGLTEGRVLAKEAKTVHDKLAEWAKKWDSSAEVHELSPLLQRLLRAYNKWAHV